MPLQIKMMMVGVFHGSSTTWCHLRLLPYLTLTVRLVNKEMFGPVHPIVILNVTGASEKPQTPTDEDNYYVYFLKPEW